MQFSLLMYMLFCLNIEFEKYMIFSTMVVAVKI